MVFEPGMLKLHVAFGDGKQSATMFSLKAIDLNKLFVGKQFGTEATDI
jgi:hypothetical protein